MFSRVKKLVTSFAAVAAAYYLYALTVVPLIEPSVKPRTMGGLAAGEPTPRTQTAPWAALFPAGSWELDEPKVLETDEGLLLLKDYQPHDDGRLELKPCTAILNAPVAGADQASRKRPVILQAPAGAELRFDHLDLTRGRIGRLQGGRLVGAVTIRSPESRPGAADPFEFQSHDVVLTRERVHTPHEVVFRYGASHGAGRELCITWRSPEDQPGPPAAKLRPGLGALQMLELTRVDRVHLDLDATSEVARPAGRPRGKAPRPKLELELTCQGPFRYDFATQTASFEERVAVTHANPDGARDQLSCQRLLIALTTRAAEGKTPQAAEGKTPPAAGGAKAPDVRDLTVAQIEARGAPVVLRAPSYAAFAQATTLAYDFRTRTFRIDDGQRALLRFRQYEVETRELTYQLGLDNRLGQLRATGPGVLRGPLAQLAGQPFEASWSERVIIQPDQGCHAISLLSQATWRCPGFGQFTADNVHVWLRESEEPAGPPPGKPKISYLPDRVLAERNVRVDSWQLRGAVQRAEIWFRYAAAAPVTPAGPAPAAARPPRGERRGPVPTAQRFEIQGDRLQAQVVRHGEKNAVEHLNLEGRVQCTAVRLDQPGEPPMRVVGDSVRLDDADKPRAHVRIQGAPAEVAARGLTLQGGDIQLLRAENRLWVTGPGTLTLPAGASKRSGGAPARPAAPRAATPLQLAWQGQLEFDGRVARFSRQVKVRGTEQSPSGEVYELHLQGETLDASLTRRIDFSREKQDGDIDVQELLFRGDVQLENRGRRQGAPSSVDHMQVRDLRLEPVTGKLHAGGPGWGTSVRLGQSLPASAPAARERPGAAPADRLVYVRVDYEDELVGNLQSRDLEFRGRVRALYGPVQDWDDKLEIEPRDGFAEGQLFLTSDRLTVSEVGPRGPQDEAPVELAAIGNATVEGRQFTARGWRIAYARAKQLLILEGDGRTDAELWRRGSTMPDAAAQQLRFWTNDNRAEVNGGRYLNLSPGGP